MEKARQWCAFFLKPMERVDVQRCLQKNKSTHDKKTIFDIYDNSLCGSSPTDIHFQ